MCQYDRRRLPNAVIGVALRTHPIVIVGDSVYDIEAGRAAGVRTVAALYGYGDPGFWKKADYRIESIEGLIKILDSGAA